MKQLKLCGQHVRLALKYPSQYQVVRSLGSAAKKSPEDLKLNLPNAGAFQLSMKNICETEEKIKKIADFEGLYKWQAENRASNSRLFRLQDGPPYANGDIHIGHMVNKVLKDIYLRYKLISGYRVEYRPGWDCHGLPIELSALKSLGKQQKKPNTKSSPLEVRQLAANFARKFIDIQMSSFRRMNLLCDWSDVYKTIDPSYMCAELDLFHKLYESNLIYRDYMPVYWSVSSQTALAESELEYNSEHLSQALYVAFEVVHIPQEIKKYLEPNQKLFAPIWTTTPWSLPCNKAIAYGPNLKYGLLSVGEKVFLLEKELLPKLKESLPCFQTGSIVENVNIDSSHLLGLKYTSPFIDGMTNSHQSFFPSDHVSAKQGTGLVHIAPALGHDDFKLGLKYGLENRCVIDAQGKYTDDDAVLNNLKLTSLKVLDESTTNRIKEILADSILHENKHKHSYPYDWRTKKPCIIRSSMQWFIDTNRLKDNSLKALNGVQIRPSSVANTMSNNLANRPYWCISRQRAWGLPIPCVYEHDDAGHRKPILSTQFIDLLKELIKKEGNVDFWWSGKYDSEFEKVLGKPMDKLVKSADIFDIWFDSGSAFMASHNETSNSNNKQEADLYCEGIDQFTGWFQSSLLLSVAMNSRSPYKNLLVHGFVVDESDRKMSKSIGNVIEPRQVIEGSQAKKLPAAGLDTMRFWVAHEHHKPQIQIGPGIVEKFLKRTFEIRSVVRFVTANLNDFDPSSSTVDYERLLPLDKYILANLRQTIDVVKANYDDMNISKALNILEAFILIKLSSYYIKCVKDRLYCEPKQSHKRLSAQTTLSHILINTLIMLAPIMPHLAEEAFHYSYLSKNHRNGLFRSDLTLSLDSKWSNDDIERLFELVNQIRQDFNEKVGSDNAALYSAEIKLSRNGLDLFGKENDWLIEIFGCSDIKLNEFNPNSNELGVKYSLNVSRIDQSKRFSCVRCRRHVNENENELCKRCSDVMNSTHG